MTTSINLLAAGMVSPDASGSVFVEPYSVKATNDVWRHPVVIFNDTATRIGIYGACAIPDDYGSSPSIQVIWTATATSGDVEWDFDYRAITGDNSESMDQSGTQETVNNNDTAPGAAHRRMACTLALTGANLAAGDTLEWSLWRDGTDSGDTMAAAAIVHEVRLVYTAA